MRPALVWGCTRYPSRSSATISERTVADETCTPGACGDVRGAHRLGRPDVLAHDGLQDGGAASVEVGVAASGGVGLVWFGVEGHGGCLALDSTECQRHRPRRPRPGAAPWPAGIDSVAVSLSRRPAAGPR